jgi:hypothetical protein
LQSIVENPSFLYVFKPYILLFQTKIPFIMKKLLTTLALLCITAPSNVSIDWGDGTIVEQNSNENIFNTAKGAGLIKIYGNDITVLKCNMNGFKALNVSGCTTLKELDCSRNKIFVIEDTIAWNPNLRSKTAIRTSDTRYFIDPSIAVAALGLGPNDLIGDLNTMGFLFETLCIRDLRVFADALKALAKKIDTNKMNSPSFLMVLTGTEKFAYRRKDGVYVVPIGCLKN